MTRKAANVLRIVSVHMTLPFLKIQLMQVDRQTTYFWHLFAIKKKLSKERWN